MPSYDDSDKRLRADIITMVSLFAKIANYKLIYTMKCSFEIGTIYLLAKDIATSDNHNISFTEKMDSVETGRASQMCATASCLRICYWEVRPRLQLKRCTRFMQLKIFEKPFGKSKFWTKKIQIMHELLKNEILRERHFHFLRANLWQRLNNLKKLLIEIFHFLIKNH